MSNAKTPRTWALRDGIHTSSDGYTLKALTPAEYGKLTRGRCSASDCRHVYVVLTPDGGALSDYPGVVSGHTVEKAKAALERYWRRFHAAVQHRAEAAT